MNQTKKRYMTLKRNLERLNIFNVCLTSYRGEEFPEEMNFSYILLDVPCSGWGTANKNPRVMDIWHGDKIVPLIKLQRELLKKAYSSLVQVEDWFILLVLQMWKKMKTR